jgi:hypothetical protein
MGALLDRVKLSLLEYGRGVADNFKNNSLYFYNKYSKSDSNVQSVRVQDLQMGRFYFFHYKDDSNWIRYSPVFTIEFRKFENLVIVLAINLNLIPIEVRASFFDQFIIDQNMDQDLPLKADFQETYKKLLRYGFEYAIREYNMEQLVLCHRINMKKLPTFLYSGHPINKYDPIKLYDIWKVKLKTKQQRDKEMSLSLINDFYEISDDINENYKVLKNHIKRLQSSISKYGRT